MKQVIFIKVFAISNYGEGYTYQHNLGDNGWDSTGFSCLIWLIRVVIVREPQKLHNNMM